MRGTGKVLALALALAAVLAVLAACSGGEEAGPEAQAEEVLIPISVNGTQIKVGETTVQALLDQGIDVYWVDENYERVTVDPDQVLEANSYYSGGNISVTDDIYAQISLVTDEEDIPMGQAVIARLEFRLYGEEDPAALDKLEFDGVKVTELTRDKAGEMYPDWTGDENMWLHYGLDYRYDLNFDSSTGQLTQFTVEREYDVDWTGGDEEQAAY